MSGLSFLLRTAAVCGADTAGEADTGVFPMVAGNYPYLTKNYQYLS